LVHEDFRLVVWNGVFPYHLPQLKGQAFEQGEDWRYSGRGRCGGGDG
jgi:hypothetical protein